MSACFIASGPQIRRLRMNVGVAARGTTSTFIHAMPCSLQLLCRRGRGMGCEFQHLSLRLSSSGGERARKQRRDYAPRIINLSGAVAGGAVLGTSVLASREVKTFPRDAGAASKDFNPRLCCQRATLPEVRRRCFLQTAVLHFKCPATS